MYKNIHNYTPFEHENLEFKNAIINNARGQDKTTVEGIMTSVLIYTNLVDYLTRHLLDNLNQMVSIFTFQKLGGVVFYDGSTKKTNVSLGELQKELKSFEFPNKKDFLESIDEFKKLRNKVMHDLMSLDPNDKTNTFDSELKKITEMAEDILAKYNVIVAGLGATWNTYK